jgi:hypothetical protein
MKKVIELVITLLIFVNASLVHAGEKQGPLGESCGDKNGLEWFFGSPRLVDQLASSAVPANREKATVAFDIDLGRQKITYDLQVGAYKSLIVVYTLPKVVNVHNIVARLNEKYELTMPIRITVVSKHKAVETIEVDSLLALEQRLMTYLPKPKRWYFPWR